MVFDSRMGLSSTQTRETRSFPHVDEKEPIANWGTVHLPSHDSESSSFVLRSASARGRSTILTCWLSEHRHHHLLPRLPVSSRMIPVLHSATIISGFQCSRIAGFSLSQTTCRLTQRHRHASVGACLRVCGTVVVAAVGNTLCLSMRTRHHASQSLSLCILPLSKRNCIPLRLSIDQLDICLTRH